LLTLADYRQRYDQARRDPDLVALHRAAPWVALWDDHELADNAWLRGAAGHDPQRDGDVTKRFEAARRAWWEWAPAPIRTASDPADPAEGASAPLDRHLAIGTLCDLLLVDTRATGRQQPVDTSGRPSAEPQDGRRLLNAHQRQLLHERLTTSAARWRILANQVQIAPLRLGYVPSPRKPYLRPLINPDQWDGYPEEREALVGLLQTQHIGNTLALSGDLHATFVRATGERHRPVLPELTTPSATSPSFGSHAKGKIGLPAPLTTLILKVLNRDIGFIDLTRHGFSVLSIEPNRIGLDVHLLKRIDRSQSPPVEVRRFELRAGQNRITALPPRPC
jgi:alkaline phosphatase D